MNKYVLSAFFALSGLVAGAQTNVGINTTTPDASAALEVKSTTQGMLIPRMTQQQRGLIGSPATGLMVYQTDGTEGFYFYNGSTWSQLGATGPQGIPGATGSAGATGATGANGKNSLAKTTAELAGANCTTGGVKLEYGVDTNNNGSLEAGEVDGSLTRYICNGTQGATGANGSNGTNGTNGTNGAAGATGANGFNSVAATSVENAGANCATGGVKIQFGIDANSNGTLDAGEVNTSLTRYVCNGATGATGAAGSNGTNGTNGTNGAAGATGATGPGVAVGGSAGQVLAKIDATNYNTQWVTPSTGSTPVYARRTVQATVSTTSPTYTTVVSINLEANKTYSIYGLVIGSRAGATNATATARLKYTGNATTDFGVSNSGTIIQGTTFSSTGSHDTEGAGSTSTWASAVSTRYELRCIIYTTSSGTFSIEVARSTANTTNDLTLYPGSYLIATPL